jgi:hypothetical protein
MRVILSLPARPNWLLPGLQGQRSEGDLEMHLIWISRRCRVQWRFCPSTTLTLLRHEERERHDGKRKTDPRRKRPPSLRVRPTA